MNSVQMTMPGNSSMEEPASSAVRGNKGTEANTAKDQVSFRKRLQDAHQAKKDSAQAKEKQDTATDQAAQPQNTVDPVLSAAQAQSAQETSTGDTSVTQGIDAVEGDQKVNLVDLGSLIASQPNLLNLVSLENPVAVDAPKTSDNPLPAVPAAEVTQAAADVPVPVPAPAPATQLTAVPSTEVTAVQNETGTNVQPTAETQTLLSQTSQTAKPAVEEQSPKTANSQSADGQGANLPVIQLSVQSDGTSGKDKTTQKQGSEVKRIMEYESQRLPLNPLNTRGQKGSDAQTSSNSDDSSSLAVFTHHAELDLTKTGFKQTLDSQPVFNTQTPDTKDLLSQVVQKAELMIKQGTSEMNIQLKPELLGKMTITVSMQDGVVTTRFLTENQQVKNILDQNIQALRQNLEAQGMKVDKTEVNVQLDSGGMFGGFGGRQQDFWQQQQSTSFNGGTTGQISEATVDGSLNQLPAYNQAQNLYGSGSDSIDYRI